MSSSAAKVARSSFLYLLGDASGVLIGIPTLAYFTRALSVAELGLVVGMGILLEFLQLFSDPGLSSAIITYSSEALGMKQNASRLIRNLTLIGVGLGLLLGVSFLLLGNIVFSYVLKIEISSTLLSALSLDVVLMSAAPCLDGSLKGLNDFKALTFTRTIRNFTRQLGGIALLSIGLGVPGIVVGWIVGDSINLIQGLFIYRDLKPYSVFPEIKLKAKEVIEFSFPLFGSNMIGYFSQYFDRIFLLLVLSIEDLAVYNVAFVIFSYALRFPESVSTILLPHYARMKGKDGISALQAQAGKATRYVSLIFTPLLTGLASVSLPVIWLLAGSQYSEGAGVLAILCLIFALTMSSMGFNQILFVLKATKVIAVLEVVGTLVGVSIGVFLANPLGILGVALARGIAEITTYLLEFRTLRGLISINLDKSSLVRIFLCSLTMALIVYLAQQIYYAVQLLPLYVLIGATSYLLLVRELRVVGRRDIGLAKELLGPKFDHLIDRLGEFFQPRM